MPDLVALHFPKAHWPGPLLNVNNYRGHTAVLAHKVKPWRSLGRDEASAVWNRRGQTGLAAPVRVWLEVTFPTNHRRDSANLYPTAKALLDGVVDAGLLPGDHDGTIEGPWIRRRYPNGPEHLQLVFEPIDADELGRSPWPG